MRDVKPPEVRKAEILNASLKLFMEKGYLKTTTQDIIQSVGISRGLLYYHFKNKEEILYILVENTMHPVIKNIQSVVNDTKLNALEKVNKFLEITVIDESSVTVESKTLQESISLKTNQYMMDQLNHKLVQEVVPLFTQIIEEGNRTGLFDVTTPTETAFFLITGYAFVASSLKFTIQTEAELKNYQKSFKDIFERTLISN
ncbi:TetR family transcriptional regulator [Natranaerovirga hydrolytica]|uniref:TetR family transcriptional regulator n=1 Tax=Natranaerovirga hydrolytica TaxID=680378 RepID=A0A4R1N3X4_9FIRM|nr:TetR/AcrR family transcriptional regulator [Natranaerovirga hydrolytica]TCK98774.1 TetR family transcriptional regulator [Natranaerovirga hydrolytica]